MSRCSSVCAIVTAAGEGRRLGADKALVELGDRTALEQVLARCAQGGVSSVVVVRREGAQPLPARLPQGVQVATATGGEMIDSIRAGLQVRPRDADGLLVFPIDHAMVEAESIAAILVHLDRDADRVVLPLHAGRPGHPIGLALALEREILDPRATSLRDVIRAVPSRVVTVPVRDLWVLRDLDTPADLAAARAALRAIPAPATELMRRHRSRRAFRPDPIPDEQLACLVDAARHAPTSSYLQAYAVVAVREPSRKAVVAELCGDQEHIRQAPVFLAICADLHKVEAACRLHELTLDPGSLEIFLQSTLDAALLGQNLLLAAESEGLGGCMIGAARNHPRRLAELLGLPPRVYVVFGLVLGYPCDDPIPRGRMPLPGVLHEERYADDRLAAALPGADEAMREWSRRTNAERGGYQGRQVDENKGWTDRVAALWCREKGQPKGRKDLVRELRELGFGLEEVGTSPG
jgi:nitroreductase/CTP:molybdopterin cytidylyltransferase MocA